MTIVIPDAALVNLLLRMAGNGQSGVDFHLFVNNHTVTVATILADMSEATWSGYAAVNVAYTDYTIQSVSAHQGTIIAPPFSWGNSSGTGQTAYGYFVTQTGSAVLLWAANFDSPPATVPNGGGLATVPIIGDMWAN